MTIDQFNFAGKKAFVRVDFNVPLDENFNITDDNRMRAALPTLKKILADGGSIIIGSHLGRPKGPADKFSLKHILKHLSELLGVEVQFANDCMGEEAAVKAAALQPGEVLLLENLRFYAEEEGKPRGLAEDATDEEKVHFISRYNNQFAELFYKFFQNQYDNARRTNRAENRPLRVPNVRLPGKKDGTPESLPLPCRPVW